jgi:hypothetical protein
MSAKKPRPHRELGPGRVCPVCGKASYSVTGIHPQCAMAREAAAQHALTKSATAVAVDKPPASRSWWKQCPRCRRKLAPRRAVCDCGYSLLPNFTG